ncbi:pyridoxamine 5'-phosphate oxidase family protein [Fusobacterium canifelinum]|uniref:Pyridoxamine 5'-phosphate oxidase family protein n=1 Tax=Fusobacterium canifelinum TaxID=285729 RepID=A0A3P1V2M0_9FUSO|nr:pyridoxamine 5'-phosphate oxidase family protein [Fusobacterium canifelinum]QQB73183.1 pyridoxamine 5'-phosphate oxidase family protein [Fusobacterium canifelinum]RRD28341.1 pyridoxamine 5'-phosphate oxidase family protein [Fusobacterium canifelinum]
MRKADREIKSIEEIVDIIKKCDVIRLAFNNGDYPYILPLNFGFEFIENKVIFYFHSALEGTKVDIMKKDNRVSFEMDTKHELQYYEEKGYCTMSYESVIGKGKIKILSEDEKINALKKLMGHYHKDENTYFNPAAISRTLVYSLEVEEMTAKKK